MNGSEEKKPALERVRQKLDDVRRRQRALIDDYERRLEARNADAVRKSLDR